MLGVLNQIEDSSVLIPLAILTIFSLITLIWISSLFISTSKDRRKNQTSDKTGFGLGFFARWWRRLLSREILFHRIERVTQIFGGAQPNGAPSRHSADPNVKYLYEIIDRMKKENESLNEAYQQARIRLGNVTDQLETLKMEHIKDKQELQATKAFSQHMKTKLDSFDGQMQTVFSDLEQVYRRHPEIPEFQQMTIRLRDLLKEAPQRTLATVPDSDKIKKAS